LTIPASTSELVFGEENYDITRDPSTGWIHFKSKLSGIESRDVQLLSINGVRYRAEKFSANEYRFAGLNRVFVSSATTGTVKLADDHDYMIQVDANGRIKLTQVYINEFSRDQVSIILGAHIYEVERVSDTLLNFRDEAGQIVQSGISGTVTLHGKSYEVIIHEDGVVTLAGDTEISSSLSRKLIAIGDTIYVIRQEKDGRFSFTHDEDVAYSSLTNLLDLNSNKIFQVNYDQATGKLHVWERDHIESQPVELLEIKMPSTTRRVTFAGKTYEFDYNVIDMVENTLTGDKHMQRPLFRFTQQDDAIFENRTYKFQGSAMACHNSDCDSYDILSTDRNQYTIDLPEATLRLDTYPRVYAYAVMVDGRLFYMYERSTKDHSFYSEGTYYNSWTESCGEKCVREYVQLPDGKGGAVKMEIHYGPRVYYDEGASNADYFGTRVKMDVVDKGGAANVQVMPQLEISTDVVQTARYYFAEKNPVTGQWAVTESESGTVYPVTQKVEIDDKTYRVQVDAANGKVSLIEDHMISRQVPGRLAVRVGNDAAGYNYSLRSDGRFEFLDGVNTYLSDNKTGKPAVTLADGNTYFIAYNVNTQELTLTEQYEISVPSGAGKLGIGQHSLSYQIHEDGTVTFAEGLKTYTSAGEIELISPAKRPVQYKLDQPDNPYGPIQWEPADSVKKPYIISYNPATGDLTVTEKQIPSNPQDYVRILGYSKKIADFLKTYEQFFDDVSVSQLGDLSPENLQRLFDGEYIHNDLAGYSDQFVSGFNALKLTRLLYEAPWQLDPTPLQNYSDEIPTFINDRSGFPVEEPYDGDIFGQLFAGRSQFDGAYDILFDTPNHSNATGRFRNLYLPVRALQIYQDEYNIQHPWIGGINRVFEPAYNGNASFVADNGPLASFSNDRENNFRDRGLVIDGVPYDPFIDPVTQTPFLKELTSYHLDNAGQPFLLAYRLKDENGNTAATDWSLFDSTFVNLEGLKGSVLEHAKLSGFDYASGSNQWETYSLNDVLADPDAFGYTVSAKTLNLNGEAYQVLQNPVNQKYFVIRSRPAGTLSVVDTLEINDQLYQIRRGEGREVILTGRDGEALKSDPDGKTIKIGDRYIFDISRDPLTQRWILTEKKPISHFGETAILEDVSNSQRNGVFYTSVHFHSVSNPSLPLSFEIPNFAGGVEFANQAIIETPAGHNYELYAFRTSNGAIWLTDGRDGGVTVATDKFNQIMLEERRYSVKYSSVDNKVRLELLNETYGSRQGVMVDGHLYEIHQSQGSYNVQVGGGMPKITWVTQSCGEGGCRTVDDTPSYIPNLYESNPIRNTVTLNDGIERELMIDIDDPSNVDIAPDQIQSFDLPDIKLGNRYFQVIKNADGYIFREAYTANPKRYTGDAVNKLVLIDGKLYDIQENAAGRVTLVLKSPAQSTVQPGQYVELSGRVYGWVKDNDGRIIMTDYYQTGVQFISDPENNTIRIYDKTFVTSQDAQGRFALTEVIKSVEASEGTFILDGTYYQSFVTRNDQNEFLVFITDGNHMVFSGKVEDRDKVSGARLTPRAQISLNGKPYSLELAISETLQTSKIKQVLYAEQTYNMQEMTWKFTQPGFEDENNYEILETLPSQNNRRFVKLEYKLTVLDTKVLRLTEPTASSMVAMRIQVNDVDYLVFRESNDRNSNATSYRFVSKDGTYWSEPANQTVSFDNKTLFKVSVSEAGDVALEEMHVKSFEVQKLEIDGRYYTVIYDPSDPLHPYRFNDGYGEYVSTRDTFGFEETNGTLYSAPALFGDSRSNAENLPPANILSGRDLRNLGDKFSTNELNYQAQVTKDGFYEVGLSVKLLTDLQNAVYAYSGKKELAADHTFHVYVDGKYFGDFHLTPGTEEFQRAALKVLLEKGIHDLKFVWDVPKIYGQGEVIGGYNIQVKDVFVMAENAYQADLNRDYVVDQKDEAILAALIAQNPQAARSALVSDRSFVDLAGKRYEIVQLQDGGYQLVSGTEAPVTADGAGHFRINGLDYELVIEKTPRTIPVSREDHLLTGMPVQSVTFRGKDYWVHAVQIPGRWNEEINQWEPEYIQYRFENLATGERLISGRDGKVILEGRIFKIEDMLGTENRLTLREAAVQSEFVADRVIEINGYRYRVTHSGNITRLDNGTQVYDIAPDAKSINLDGYDYTPVFEGGILKQLIEIIPDTRPVFLQTLRIANRVLSVARSQANPNEFLFSDGTNLFKSQAETMQVSIFGIPYKLTVASDDTVSLEEIALNIEYISAREISINGTVYLVQYLGNENYGFSSSWQSIAQNGDGSVTINGRVIQVRTDENGNIQLLEKLPEVSQARPERIVVVNGTSYQVTKDAAQNTWTLTAGGQPFTTNASTGLVTIGGVPYLVSYDSAADVVTVADTRTLQTDVDGNGVTDAADYAAITSRLGMTFVRRAGDEAVHRSDTFAWNNGRAGAEGQSEPKEYHLDYDFDVAGLGHYELNVRALSFAAASGIAGDPVFLAPFDHFTFAVYVDGNTKPAGFVRVEADAITEHDGKMLLDLAAGSHRIRLAWVNP
ncbi:MAG: hypothetical protein HYZ84_07705, partial [Candidatus Omnitrophica bacterium]|nr:hypothetical protein [Candidatus Omnitrophota bacterium]